MSNNTKELTGPLMISIEGTELQAESKEILEHPAVGGVIIFARNYESLEQIAKLNFDIKNLKTKNSKNNNSLVISVDQEGGSVQRIKHPLTVLPHMAALGKVYEIDQNKALSLAQDIGWLLATELLPLGFDFSFTPVVDLNLSNNPIIKNRAFHHQPEIVAKVAVALRQGLNSAGMCAVAKHFPGHGGVKDDSHITLPVDDRSFATLDYLDLEPYRQLIADGLEAIMTSHIMYSKIDPNITTYSKFWLKDILRNKLGFKGLTVSDDLSMEGANIPAMSYKNRVSMALEAGCDSLLLCNNQQAIIEVLDQWANINWQPDIYYANKLNNMRAKNSSNQISDLKKISQLRSNKKWQRVVEDLNIIYTT